MMIQNDRDPQVEPFPTKLIGIAALTTLAVFAWLSWFIYDEYQIVQDTNTRIVGLERVRGDIVHLDEVLTMSASMAAATNIELVRMENQAFELVRFATAW